MSFERSFQVGKTCAQVSLAGRAGRVYYYITNQLPDCAERVNPLIVHP